MSESQRIIWIDNAKGLILFFVLIIHAQFPWHVLSFVCSWIMPCLFLISGFLFRIKNDSIRETIIHRTKTLLIPYFALSILFVFLNPNNYNGDVLAHFKSNAWDILMGTSGFMTISLWFVYVLFELYCVTTILHKLLHQQNSILRYGVLFFVGAICIVLDALFKDITLPFKLSYFFMSMFMYLLGYMAQDQIKYMSRISNKQVSISALIAVVVSIVVYLFPKPNNPFVSELLRVGLLLTGSVSLIGIVYVMTQIVPENFIGRSLRYWAKNAMCFLAFHMWTICLCNLYMPCMSPYIRATLAMVVFLVFAPITNKYTPWLLGKSLS